ncbi:MAG: cyclic nucleotide-binding domain-containing protein [Patescibacteria group bacterium]
MNDLIETLRTLPFFKGLTTDHLRVVAAACIKKNFAENAVVIQEGAIPDGMYVIIAGSALVERGERKIADLHVNDFFGELALLAIAKPRTATVRAAEKLETLFLPTTAFNNVKLGLSTEVFNEIVRRIGA